MSKFENKAIKYLTIAALAIIVVGGGWFILGGMNIVPGLSLTGQQPGSVTISGNQGIVPASGLVNIELKSFTHNFTSNIDSQVATTAFVVKPGSTSPDYQVNTIANNVSVISNAFSYGLAGVKAYFGGDATYFMTEGGEIPSNQAQPLVSGNVKLIATNTALLSNSSTQGMSGNVSSIVMGAGETNNEVTVTPKASTANGYMNADGKVLFTVVAPTVNFTNVQVIGLNAVNCVQYAGSSPRHINTVTGHNNAVGNNAGGAITAHNYECTVDSKNYESFSVSYIIQAASGVNPGGAAQQNITSYMTPSTCYLRNGARYCGYENPDTGAAMTGQTVLTLPPISVY